MKRRLPHGNLLAIALLGGAASLLLGMHDPPYVSHDEANSVSSVMIQNRAIGDKKLQLDVVRSVHIQNGSVFTYDIHDGTIQAEDMANNSVGSRILKQKSVKASHMNAAVAGSPGQALIHQGTHVAWADPDYAGAASTNSNGGVTLSGGVETILSRSITVPASGFVLAIGTCQANAFHTNGTTTNASFGVSDAAGVIPSTQDVGFFFESGLPSGQRLLPVTVQAIFSVTAGTHTFYFLGEEIAGDVSVNDMTLSLIYVPAQYGSVATPVRDAGPTETFDPAFAPVDMGIQDPNLSAAAAENADLRARVETLERIVSDLLEDR
jgi:hypothetical protein